ncbi:hypothetical protein EKK58_01595 [Candidatus Dependentiae bacterium]|nr:MAG: hypothetical protein EKK58_01595 [Candidatus Dependentiae bacterium]
MNYFKQLATSALLLSSTLLLPQDNGLLKRYLEPAFPHLHPQKTWWNNGYNLIMSEEFYPIKNAIDQINQISFDRNKDDVQKSEEIERLFDSWLKKLYDPLNWGLLLSSQLVAEYVIEPSLNYLFPNNPIHTLFTDNQMMVMGRFLLSNTIADMVYFQKINPSICNHTLPQKILATISSIGILSYAHTIRPDLFEHCTYFDFNTLAWNKNTVLYLALFGIRKASDPIQTTIKNYTTIFNYSLLDLVQDVDTIFATKQNLFLLSIIFGCFFINTKKNLYTNPAYWLPIGVLHVLYTKKQYGMLLADSCNKYAHKVEDITRQKSWLPKNSYLITYACHHAIPILAVLVNTVLPT